MRLWHPLLLALPLVSAREAQVFLFPSPPSSHADTPKAPPTLSAEQAQAVLANHLGGSGGISQHKTPEDEGMWAHLLHLWEGEKRPRVVVIQDADLKDILPDTLSTPSFYMESWDAQSVMEPYLDAARAAVERVLKLPLVKTLLDTLDLAVSKAGEKLAQELASLVALADHLWSSAEHEWDAVSIRLGLAEPGSALHKSATKGVKAGLQSMTQPDSPPLLLVVMPSSSRHYSRAVRAPNDTDTPVKPKHDYTQSFAILAGASLFIVFAIAGSISLLFSVGENELPSTLTLSISRPRHD
ncbi:uncharacterized protein LOC62_04G006500 [Vanrija pseudolonga]|uniref:Vacuolar sorting protein Vps3844 C-terminal domain-containing protein n=1 Tax=Vanrija pseudolonga TaxID=143232 RepID=A0AAF0YAH9_9TREE|nr:hypothetical protein LOC62_04G006500 [Vanrija pseudolonga]